VSVHPSRLPAALVGLTLAVGLTGCAGTTSPDSGGSASSSSSTSSSSTPGTASAVASPSGQRIEVQVAGGQVSGDTGRVPVAAGTPVTLVVTSDVADEAHLHGYDIAAELAPGKPAELTFDATIPGVFEFELHEAGTVLLTLQVQ
jgi:hypothetical protein